MKIKLAIAFMAITSMAVGQTVEQRDSIVNEICKTIVEHASKPDSIRVQIAYETHLFPVMEGLTDQQMRELASNIFYRLQRNCVEFKKILEARDPPRGDWSVVDKKPVSKLDQEGCRSFLEHEKYAYLESTGDTVVLHIENGYWTDRFKNGTYSKLKFNWIGDCEFEIEFVESNNYIRKNLSKPGDKYRYQILDKKDGYYDMSAQIPGIERFMLFKVYY
jgi:hypothetical protein